MLNFAQFAQNLWMCTTKLEKSCNFAIFTCFLLVFTPFMQLFGYLLRISLRKILKSKILPAQENHLLERLPQSGFIHHQPKTIIF